jgi:hypothetical protein
MDNQALKDCFHFDGEGLAANRLGQITEKQKVMLLQADKTKRTLGTVAGIFVRSYCSNRIVRRPGRDTGPCGCRPDGRAKFTGKDCFGVGIGVAIWVERWSRFWLCMAARKGRTWISFL